MSETEHVMAAAGPAGAIPVKAQVERAFQFIREHIGENVPMEFSWDRTGAQTFPLLRGQDWSALKLFGKRGHIQLSTKGSKLPIDSLGFGYQIDGDDVILDADPVRVEGLASRLTPSSAAPMAAAQPVGFVDPMTLWTVFGVFRAVWEVLHPTCDLTLGGNVSATSILSGNLLGIDFEEMPSIRLQMWVLKFNPSVKRIEVVPTQGKVLFTGSRFVRERTFELT